jgi:hypothetical protein
MQDSSQMEGLSVETIPRDRIYLFWSFRPFIEFEIIEDNVRLGIGARRIQHILEKDQCILMLKY